MVLFVNKSDESQSDCKDLQWFQDGCNKKDTLAILSKQGYIQQTHWAVQVISMVDAKPNWNILTLTITQFSVTRFPWLIP